MNLFSKSRDEASKPLISSSHQNSRSALTSAPQSPPRVKRTNRRTGQRSEESASDDDGSKDHHRDVTAEEKNYNSISASTSSSTSSTYSTSNHHHHHHHQDSRQQTADVNKKWNTSSESATWDTSSSNMMNNCTRLLWIVAVLGIGYRLGRSTIQARLVMTRTKAPHQQPTLLSVVNPQSNDYVRARMFYLQYDQWKLNMKTPVNLLLKTTMMKGDDDSSSQKAPFQLQLDKTEMHNPRESLTVSWKDVADHPGVRLSDDDLLVLYCTSDADDDDEYYNFNGHTNNIKTMEIATLAQAKATSQKHSPKQQQQQSPPQHWYQRKRHHYEWIIPAFPMVRESHCWFTLYSTTTTSNNENNEYPVLAHSPILELFLKEKPTNVHLARGDDPTKMIVHFSTAGSEGGHPVAMYGVGTATTQKSEGTSTTFAATEMCSSPANETDTGKFIDPGFLHTVELTGLQPDTVYSYKVGLTFGQGVVWSDTFEFTSPVTSDYFNATTTDGDNTTTKTYTYLVYGDQGCPSVGWGEGGKWTAAMAARETEAREVHHIGDLSYARGAGHIWDEWLAMVSGSFATKLPLMVAVGNHEYDHTMGGDHGKDPSGLEEVHGFMPTWGNMGDDSGGECGVPTSKHFQMPASSLGSNGVFWYSYVSANVHTIVLSSEHDLSSSSVQYQWLEAELSTINRTVTPWVVVELHRPLYFNEALWPDVAVGIGMRQEFENLLGWYSVDLVVAGHVHSYFRSCSGLWHSKCDNGGPTHLVVGAAGAVLDNAPTYANGWAVKNIQGIYGYGRITVHNDTWMHFEFVQAGPDDDQHAGDVLDDVWITHSSKIA